MSNMYRKTITFEVLSDFDPDKWDKRVAVQEDAAMESYYSTYEAALLGAAFIVEQRLDLQKHYKEAT